MPSVEDIVEIAESLETQPLAIVPQKCVAVRNRNSSCKRCIEACPVDVITIERNELTIDFEHCIGCQACTAVCPTEALIPAEPLDTDMAAQAAASYAFNQKRMVVIACARVSTVSQLDPRAIVEVPCLSRVEESLLIDLVSRGVERVILLDGVCKTCKFRDCDATTQQIFASANDVLDAWGTRVRIERTSEVPYGISLEDTKEILGESRRHFFSSARKTAQQAAVKTAVKSLKLEEDKPTLRQLLQVGSGKMPQFEPVRRRNTVDALDRIGEPIADELTTHLWGRVKIDTDKCNACGMCPVFCPTGALRKADEEVAKAAGADLLLEFNTCDCTQCDLCADVCFRDCLTVERTISTHELMDFEPVEYECHIPRGNTTNKLFS